MFSMLVLVLARPQELDDEEEGHHASDKKGK